MNKFHNSRNKNKNHNNENFSNGDTSNNLIECCYYKQSFCKFGQECRFSHTDSPENPCQFGKECRFEHGKLYYEKQLEEKELILGMNNMSKALEAQLFLEEPKNSLPSSSAKNKERKQEYSKLTRSVPPPQTSMKKQRQPFDYYCILDIEGKKEIIEFPVFLLNSKTGQTEAKFHHYVIPCKIPKEDVKNIIRSKYGKFPEDPVTGKTFVQLFFERAIPFDQVFNEFKLWLKKNIPPNKTFAFITCGNWDICTKIPEQCEISQVPLPDFFYQWINIKDIFFNFYNYEAKGMKAMLKGLDIEWDERFHHSGLDDVENITKIVKIMIEEGATIEITAAKDPKTGVVSYLYSNRI